MNIVPVVLFKNTKIYLNTSKYFIMKKINYLSKISMAVSVLALTVFLFSTEVNAQKYITKNGHIRFFSSSPMEDLEANNYQVNAVLDTETGAFVFKILMKSFEFEKALMQEHFNENYVNSDKYPNATFKGQVVNYEEIDFSKEGKYDASIEGDLTIKGVTNAVKETGTFEVTGDGKVHGLSVFNIKLSDYKIKIPSAVTDNISESIEITVDIKLDALEK